MLKKYMIASVNALLFLAVLTCVCPQHSQMNVEIFNTHSACHQSQTEQPIENTQSCDQCSQEDLLATDIEFDFTILSASTDFLAQPFAITENPNFLGFLIRNKPPPLQHIRMNC